MVEAPEKIWPLGGYAPGNYTCRCLDCGEQFIGDKRAITCLDCAVTAAKSQIAELRTERDHAIAMLETQAKLHRRAEAHNARLSDERVVTEVLEALEPWLLQMMRFNPDEGHMRTARQHSAHVLVALFNEVEKSGV